MEKPFFIDPNIARAKTIDTRFLPRNQMVRSLQRENICPKLAVYWPYGYGAQGGGRASD